MRRGRRTETWLLVAAATCSLACSATSNPDPGASGAGGSTGAMTSGAGGWMGPAPLPCDAFAAGGGPCVAAHSTVRALYAAYNGPLYQVRKTADNTTMDIRPLEAGGFANAADQDTFCGASLAPSRSSTTSQDTETT